MDRRNLLIPSKSATSEYVNANGEKDVGKFTFHNGDKYEGEYKLQAEQVILVKHGSGVYTTDDFNTYACKWDHDKLADNEVHVRHNNGAQFKGGIDENGSMSGSGVYTFPDGSSIQATWLENKPHSDIIYKDARGFTWTVENISENVISFTTGNHFWDDMCEDTLPDENVENSIQDTVQNGGN